jgi:hypothetical protein
MPLRPQTHPNTLTILLGFGGSGAKTVRHLAELMTNDPESARLAHERVHVVLCDTDEGEMRREEQAIANAFAQRCPGLTLKVDTFSLSSNTDVFCDLVQSKIDDVSPEGLGRLRQNWWFQGGVPFSATGLPLSTSAGAGQCPLVSHFLAWERLGEFPEVLSRIDAYARNQRQMEDFSIDLVMVAGLAGGTGRGCWQALSFKAREHFGRNGQACRPYGFFFDQSVFEDVKRGRPEQKIKLQINSLTGLSELAMWLRSDRRMPGEPPAAAGAPPERRFNLPGFEHPENPQLDAIDTERYMPEKHLARVGRSPIHKAYVFTNESSSMHLRDARSVYALAGAAIYGRLLVGQLRSSDANQPARAATTATSVLYVPASEIRNLIALAAKSLRAARILQGRHGTDPVVTTDAETGERTIVDDGAKASLSNLDNWLRMLLDIPTATDLQMSDSQAQRRRSIAASLSMEYRAPDQSEHSDTALNEAIRNGDKASFEQELGAMLRDPSAQMETRFAKALGDALGLKSSECDRMLSEARKSKQNALDPFADHILRQLAWDHPSSIQKTARSAGGSLWLASSAIDQLCQRISELKTSCEIAIKSANAALNQTNGQKGSSDPFKGRARRGAKVARALLFWAPPLARRIPLLSKGSQDAIARDAVEQRLAVHLPHILRAYSALLSKLEDRMQPWKANAEQAVDAVATIRRRLDHDLQRGINQHFTRMSGAEKKREEALAMLETLKRDEQTPVSRMLRALRPLYSEKEFMSCVEPTLNERAPVNAEQDKFLEGLTAGPSSKDGGPDSKDAMANSIFGASRSSVSDQYRFRRATEEGLMAILGRQEASNSALEKFTLRKVLGDLMNVWIAAYENNRGDEGFCRELDEVVSRLTGISLAKMFDLAASDKLGSGIVYAPSEPSLLAHTALTLAKSCDPLVRMPAATGMSGDLVSVFVPRATLDARPNETTKEIIQEIDRIWREWDEMFHHVRADEFKSNPFMMVATSDHPKRDFDQNGWSGWTSFDYHFLETDLADWLEFVEDPSGKSVFLQGRDDSIGLGYLHPAYVRDPHWARRRWRPWFNENRQKSQDRRKWEALAYSLLGNSMYEVEGEASMSDLPFVSRYLELCDALRRTAAPNPDYPTEVVTIPLLREEAGGTGPTFTRAIFRDGPSGIRRDGVDLSRSEVGRSVRSFMEWFKSDASREALDAIWREQCIVARVMRDRGSEFYDVLSPEHRIDVRKTLHEYVRRWRTYISKSTVRKDDRDEQIAFLDEFEGVLADSSFDVLNPFDSVETAR